MEFDSYVLFFKLLPWIMSQLVIWKLSIDLPCTYTPHDVSMGDEISQKNITSVSNEICMILLPIRLLFNWYGLIILPTDISMPDVYGSLKETLPT